MHNHMKADTDLLPLLSRLVSIPSVNPALVKDSPGEKDIANFVEDWLSAHDVEVERQEVDPNRSNVIGRVRGTGGGKTLMLNAHMDTVALTGPRATTTPLVEGNRMYGRGAFDMKGSLAAIMLAAADYGRAPGKGDLLITAVVDEEYASIGTEGLVKEFHADGAVITEPTDLELSIAHKGFGWIDIETQGVAAHGSLPSEGVDAIVKMGRLLVAIEELNAKLQSGPGHPLVGSGSIHGSLIEGGSGLSTYPDRCLLSIERRTIPGETDALIMREMLDIITRIKSEDNRFHATASLALSRQPFEIAEVNPFVKIVETSVTEIMGQSQVITGENGWMDSAILANAGIPTVIFGPSGDGAHAAEEWVDVKSVEICRQIYVQLARSFCA